MEHQRSVDLTNGKGKSGWLWAQKTGPESWWNLETLYMHLNCRFGHVTVTIGT